MKTNNMKKDFKALIEKGSKGVWEYIDEAEKIVSKLDKMDELDYTVRDLTKKVKEDKRFEFEQYKLIRKFIDVHEAIAIASQMRLDRIPKPQTNDDYIIL